MRRDSNDQVGEKFNLLLIEYTFIGITIICRDLIKYVPTIRTINLSSCRSVERGLKKSLNYSEIKDFFQK